MGTLAFGCNLPTIRAVWGLAPVRVRSCWANRKIRSLAAPDHFLYAAGTLFGITDATQGCCDTVAYFSPVAGILGFSILVGHRHKAIELKILDT